MIITLHAVLYTSDFKPGIEKRFYDKTLSLDDFICSDSNHRNWEEFDIIDYSDGEIGGKRLKGKLL